MNDLERAARNAWMEWGEYAQWTSCVNCHEMTHCRAHRRGRWFCLECWDLGEYLRPRGLLLPGSQLHEL